MTNFVHLPDTNTRIVSIDGSFSAHYRQLSLSLQRETDDKMLEVVISILDLILATENAYLKRFLVMNPALIELANFLTTDDLGEISLARGKVVLTLKIEDGVLCFTKVVGRLLH